MAISWDTPETREFLTTLLGSNKPREDKIKEIIETFSAADDFDTVFVSGARGVVVETVEDYGLTIGLDSTGFALTVHSRYGLETE